MPSIPATLPTRLSSNTFSPLDAFLIGVHHSLTRTHAALKHSTRPHAHERNKELGSGLGERGREGPEDEVDDGGVGD
eukprot:3171044-Rhodomonas_salina.1